MTPWRFEGGYLKPEFSDRCGVARDYFVGAAAGGEGAAAAGAAAGDAAAAPAVEGAAAGCAAAPACGWAPGLIQHA
jgi:hypothetical protein